MQAALQPNYYQTPTVDMTEFTCSTLTSTVHGSTQHVIVGPNVLHATVPHLVVIVVLVQQAVSLDTWRDLRVGEAGRAAGSVDQRVFLRHWQLVFLLRLWSGLHHILVVESCDTKEEQIWSVQESTAEK